jgi:hypothetical protein
VSIEDELGLEQFLFVDRQCRKCLRTLSLTDNFYKTRKDRGQNPSAYSYECKYCTKKRISKTRNSKPKQRKEFDYPDW